MYCFYQVQSDIHNRNETSDSREDLSLSEEQLQTLLSGGGFVDDRNAASSQPYTHRNLPRQSPQQFTSARPGMGQLNQANIGNQLFQPFVQSNPGSALTKEEREALYEAGIPRDPTYDIPTHGHAPASQDDIQQMLVAEYHKINQPGAGEKPQFDKKFTYYQYNVSRETPVVHGIYDKIPSTMYASMPAKSSKDNFSSYLVSITVYLLIRNLNFFDEHSR